MIRHRITMGCGNGAVSLTKGFDIFAGAEHNIDEDIAAGITDREVNFALDVSQCKSFFLVSNQPVTIETNSGSAAGNVFNLAANRPFVWVEGNPPMRDSAGNVVADITSLFITNAGESVATVSIRSLVDPTI